MLYRRDCVFVLILVGVLKEQKNIEKKIQNLGDEIVYKSKIMPIIFIETNNPSIYTQMDEFENIYEERTGKLQSVKFIPNAQTSKLKKNGFLAWGVNVAIIDSGINDEIGALENIDLRGNNNPNDFLNHGTAVASIIKEVAGGVGLINLKITDTVDFKERYIIKALDYIGENLDKINVVNMSLGLSNKCQGNTCAICKTVNYLSNEGIIFIAAAGNDGPNNNTVTCPAVSESVVSVGAISVNGNSVARYSGRGKRNRFKPDLLAPGNVSVDLKCKNEKFSDEGTSFAAPIVSGVAAVLVAKFKHKEYVINSIKESTDKLPNVPDNHQGHGILNIDKIVEVFKNDISSRNSEQQG